MFGRLRKLRGFFSSFYFNLIQIYVLKFLTVPSDDSNHEFPKRFWNWTDKWILSDWNRICWEKQKKNRQTNCAGSSRGTILFVQKLEMKMSRAKNSSRFIMILYDLFRKNGLISNECCVSSLVCCFDHLTLDSNANSNWCTLKHVYHSQVSIKIAINFATIAN